MPWTGVPPVHARNIRYARRTSPGVETPAAIQILSPDDHSPLEVIFSGLLNTTGDMNVVTADAAYALFPLPAWADQIVFPTCPIKASILSKTLEWYAQNRFLPQLYLWGYKSSPEHPLHGTFDYFIHGHRPPSAPPVVRHVGDKFTWKIPLLLPETEDCMTKDHISSGPFTWTQRKSAIVESANRSHRPLCGSLGTRQVGNMVSRGISMNIYLTQTC